MKLDGQRIYVAGHQGMVGSGLVRALRRRGAQDIVTADREHVDLRQFTTVDYWFDANLPDVVILCAAKVGGIKANLASPGEFIADNLRIQTNVIEAARTHGIKRLIFLGSSCMYPRQVRQPMDESMLWSGWLEPTNEPYAVAKLAGMTMCRAYSQQYGVLYQTVIPCNLYGPGENADPETCHVIPALCHRIRTAKAAGETAVHFMGTGQACREFMHVDDAAEAILFVAENYEALEPVNVGSGDEISIDGLVNLIAKIIGWEGKAICDGGPDGAPRKLLNSGRARKLGWEPKIGLEEGLTRILGEDA